MKIIGAGLAGLIAANMLRDFNPVVYEAQPELPDNQGALLRFRSDAVSEAVRIPFRRVNVVKGWRSPYNGMILNEPPPIPILNRYSRKVTGKVMPRSMGSMEPVARWIAPPDFCAELAKGINIQFGSWVGPDELDSMEGPIIWTGPMPTLMNMAGWEANGPFDFRSILSVRTRLDKPVTDVFQTVYYPWDEPWYRASITGNLLITEYMTPRGGPDPMSQDQLLTRQVAILEHFGFDGNMTVAGQHDIVKQKHGKLIPYGDQDERRSFILAMTDSRGIYSLGRFATWRQLLLDDLVQDINLIRRMISERDDYRRRIGR